MSFYPVLALDVAAERACACILCEDGRLYAAQAESGKQHSHTILPLLQELLAQADLDWQDLRLLALGQGPGSFTGLRIAAAMLAGINASLKLPMWGLSSLAITAMQAEVDKPLWVLEDARAGEVFMGRYDEQGSPLEEDRCRDWQSIHSLPANIFVAQQDPAIDLAGWQRQSLSLSRAEAMGRLMQCQWRATDHAALSIWIQPVYLQLSQAEKNLS